MLLLSLATAAAVTFVAAGSCVRQYTVQQGDTCDKISAAQNVSTYQVATINQGIINPQCTNLMPGQTICLGYQGEDCNTVYVVVKGDTCDKIATSYNVNTTMLYENNPQIDSQCHNIYIGEVLCVANKVQVPPRSGSQSLPIPSTATPANPASTPTPSTSPPDSNDDNNNDDDEDLPYCDEL